MKAIKKMNWLWLILLAIACSSPAMILAQGPSAEKIIYFSVTINEVVCGYVKLDITPSTQNGNPIWQAQEIVEVKLSLMGQGLDLNFDTEFQIDSADENVISIDRSITTGGATIVSRTKINGQSVRFYTSLTGEEKMIELPNGAILESPLGYPHLYADFILGGVKEKIYEVFDDVRGNLEEKKYTFKGYEKVELAGNNYNTVKIEEMNLSTGSSVVIWLDEKDAFPLKFEGSGRTVQLAGESVIRQITIANADNLLFAKVGKEIDDLQNLTYMKVKGTIQTAGEWVNAEGLNFPGQHFNGTVENNLIDGVFETELTRYDGSSAPPFPPDFNTVESLNEYLKPGELIESNDPLIIAEAQRITAGSADSWEAAVRLSKWVGEEIHGAIPGGSSAINTYKLREGECGGHSRLLAAFCRAVGIPARLSVGCMYSPYYGGSFGQHAWTEIWMGDAGWIAVDATAFEFDYVDAGHIRLGEKATFNPKSMEILDYRLAEKKSDPKSAIPSNYLPYIGKYTLLQGEKVFTVLFQDNRLAVDIPGQMVLTLNEPDEEGRWYPMITRQVNFTFKTDPSGKVEKMVLQQMVPVNKSGGPEETGIDVPEDLMPYLGTYVLPAANMTLDVIYEAGSLCVIDSRNMEHVKLGEKLANGRWPVSKNEDEIEFKHAVDGKIQSLIIYTNMSLFKGEPIAGIIEKVILEEGIEKGVIKYRELKEMNTGEYLYSEESLNALGYKFMSMYKMDEAIAVFQLNVEEYPGSFNVYDSLGEAYHKNGEKKLAIKNYKKSLELNPENENGRRMLDQIRSGK